tara:strand:+ start:3877 stop:4245 length:369 start_codon:yes stop_codon:yes gene_type:complete
MNDREVKQLLRVAYTKAISNLTSQSPEESLTEFVENVNSVWNRAFSLHFFRGTEYMMPEEEEDVDPDICMFCGEIFINPLTEEDWSEIESGELTYPMTDSIRVCEECCKTIESRMPHKANLN